MTRDFKSTLRGTESIVIAVILALFIPHLHRAGFQDPYRIDGEPADWRPPPRQQVRLGRPRHRSSARCRSALSAATMSSFKSGRPRFHQARDRLPGETVEVREKKVYINGRPLEGTLPAADLRHRISRGHLLRRPRSLRSGDRSRINTVMGTIATTRRTAATGASSAGYQGKALVIYWSHEAGRED
jgi:hypothetical protein